MEDGELDMVSGGGGDFEFLDGGKWEYWYVCPRCWDYKELIVAGERGMNPFSVEGLFGVP